MGAGGLVGRGRAGKGKGRWRSVTAAFPLPSHIIPLHPQCIPFCIPFLSHFLPPLPSHFLPPISLPFPPPTSLPFPSHFPPISLLSTPPPPGSTEHLEVMARIVPELHADGLLTDDLTTPGKFPQFGKKTAARVTTPSVVQAENSIAYMGICIVGGVHRRLDLRCYPEHQEVGTRGTWAGMGLGQVWAGVGMNGNAVL